LKPFSSASAASKGFIASGREPVGAAFYRHNRYWEREKEKERERKKERKKKGEKERQREIKAKRNNGKEK
jgi:uncharacterized membrane protein